MRRGGCLALVGLVMVAAGARAQTAPSARLAVLQAEDRRAETAADLARIRAAARSADAQTARIALRALGRLERPALIADIVPALNGRLPETRAEAANAIAQAAHGWAAASGAKPAAAGASTPASTLATLAAHLATEEEPTVRAALCESIGRLPYRSATEAVRAETALLDLADRDSSVLDRLGVAKGLEALFRINGHLQPPSGRGISTLRTLAGVPEPSREIADPQNGASRLDADPLRDARVRRLAIETLISAGIVDDDLVGRAAADADAQVRRLAMRAARASSRATEILRSGTGDPAAMVRLEALAGLRETGDDACALALSMNADPDEQVALVALDQLADCGNSTQAVMVLEDAAGSVSDIVSFREWHEPARAIVALAAAAPERARQMLGPFVTSKTWQLRMYAAHAAAAANDEERLRVLARDEDDNVVEAAIAGLAQVAGSKADDLYVAGLARPGQQVIRAATIALDGTPNADVAVPALKAAFERLAVEDRADSGDIRARLAATLARLGAAPAPKKTARRPTANGTLTSENLLRLAAPRARISVRGVGSFELVLFTFEAPSTVLKFAALAEAGFYNGLTFHRVAPHLVVEGGSPGASEHVGHPDQMRDEVGLWPHVRGAVGLAAHGRDTGTGQFFINLVDNPRFDHDYTVFAQVLNGIDTVDRILEGDVVERVEIIP